MRIEVRNKSTGESVAGATVYMVRPGAYDVRGPPDAQGRFLLQAEAYTGSANNLEEGLSPERQVPHAAWQTVTPRPDTYWMVEVVASGYKTLRTSDLPGAFRIPVVSSASPELHTFVRLEVVPNESALTASGEVSVVDPYALARCAAECFSAEELADTAVSGGAADPDEDGLSNQAE